MFKILFTPFVSLLISKASIVKAWLITKYRLIKVWSCNYFPIIINPIKDCNYMNSLFQITHSEGSEGPQRRSSCCLPSSDGDTETLRGEMTFQGHTAVRGRAGLNPSSCPHRLLLASCCHSASLRRTKWTLSSPARNTPLSVLPSHSPSTSTVLLSFFCGFPVELMTWWWNKCSYFSSKLVKKIPCSSTHSIDIHWSSGLMSTSWDLKPSTN